MKRFIITFLLLFWCCFLAVFVVIPSVTLAQSVEGEQSAVSPNEQTIATEVDNKNLWESFAQTLSVDSTYFYGKYQDNIYGKDVIGFHLRPVWQRGRFKTQFDFAIYKNPWFDGGLQWGGPMPLVKPELPNFINSFSYQGELLNLNYKSVTDLNFGYGLLINDYHPTDPYHGWIAVITPTDSTKLTFISSQEIKYFVPFISNDYASLQVLRLDQSLDTGGLNWQLGLTKVHDSFLNHDNFQFPAGGGELDIALTNAVWLSPFFEAADFDNSGEAKMFGAKGKLGLISYQVGYLRAIGNFIPNYFGGRYEDLKWNSFVNTGKQGLPDLNFSDDFTHEGSISRLWLEVSPWLSFGYINIADIEDTTGYSLSGRIERLGLEYGFSYYNQLHDIYNYNWFIRGGNGFFKYEYHNYRDWEQNCRNDFEVSFKF
jgi:hypothetical protein